MDIFQVVFTLAMIVSPGVFTLLVRQKQPLSSEDHAARLQLGALTRRMWLWTGAAVFVYIVLSVWLAPGVAYFMWMAFFPLWFILALPVLRAKDPGWGPISRPPVRSARLERRDVLPANVGLAWFALTALWALLLLVAVLGLTLQVSEPPQWWLLFFLAAAGGELWLMHWALRRSLIEPEPVPENESAEIREARESFRKLKMLAWFIAAAVIVLVFSIPPVLLIWLGNGALTLAIIVGAGGGTAAGIAGGVFGAMADLRRAKINRLCLESSRHE